MDVHQDAGNPASDFVAEQQMALGRSGVSIRLAIGLIVLVALIVPMVVAWSLTYRQIFENEIDRVKEHHLLLARSVASELGRFHYEISHAIEDFGPEIVAGVDPVFAKKFLDFHGFKQFCVFDQEGLRLTRQFMQNNMDCADFLTPQRHHMIQSVLDTAEPGKVAASGAELLSFGPGVLFASEHDTAITLAVLSTEYFSKLQRPITFGQNAHLAIVDGTGHVLAHPNPEWEREAKDLSKILISGGVFRSTEGVAEFYSPSFGSDMVAGFAAVPMTGWGVMVPQPVAELRASAAAAASKSLWALLAGAMVALAVALFLSGFLERPVRKISNALRTLTQDPDSVAVLEGSPIRELNVLSHRFNQMVMQVERGKLFEKRLRQKAEENLEIAKQLADRERELRLQQEGRAQRDRLEALGRVVGGVAHDFNNILNVVLGNAELIDEIQDPKATREFTGEIILATNRGSALTKQLLAYGRRSYLEPKLHAPQDIMDMAIATARRLMPENFDIGVNYANALPYLMVDQNHFSIMILNLLTNARDASRENTRIEVSVSACRACDDILRHQQFYPAQELIQICVVDHGVGMNEDTLARSGDPFFTTKTVGSGSGLGLPMIIGFVEQSGGAFEISSTPGVGTRAQIYFPAARTPTLPAPVPQSDPFARAKPEQVKLLVVEDELALLKMLKRQLNARGFEVITACSGDEAKQLIADGLSVDILITDVVMPGIVQGFELAAWAQNRLPKLKVAVMSGYPRDEGISTKDLDPAAVFLSKPSTSRQILEAVRKLMEQDSSVKAKTQADLCAVQDANKSLN